MVATLSRSSAGPYIPDIPMHPSPMGNTWSPVEPSARGSIAESVVIFSNVSSQDKKDRSF